MWQQLFPDVTSDLSYTAAAGEVVRTIFWDGHHVAALIGSRAPLDALTGQAQSIEAVRDGAGSEQDLEDACDTLVKAVHQAIPLLVAEIEDLSDEVHEAMDALADQDAAAAAQFATLRSDLDDLG